MVVLPTPPLVLTTAIFKTRYTSIFIYRDTAVPVVVTTLIPKQPDRSAPATPNIPKCPWTDSGTSVNTVKTVTGVTVFPDYGFAVYTANDMPQPLTADRTVGGAKNSTSPRRVDRICGAKCGSFPPMATKQRGPGRPSFGERMRVPVRMAPEVYEALRVEARSRGVSMSQYLADLAAINLGLPEAVVPPADEEAISA